MRDSRTVAAAVRKLRTAQDFLPHEADTWETHARRLQGLSAHRNATLLSFDLVSEPRGPTDRSRIQRPQSFRLQDAYSKILSSAETPTAHFHTQRTYITLNITANSSKSDETSS